MAPAETLAEALPTMALATKAIHADDCFSTHRAIAPAMHVAVTYRYARSPDNLIPLENKDVPPLPLSLSSLLYLSLLTPTSPTPPLTPTSTYATTPPTRAASKPSSSNSSAGGILTYTTGLAAFHAIMVLLNPKRVFLSDGYHGVHAILDVMNKLTGVQKLSLDQLDHHHLLHPSDIIHIETPPAKPAI